MPTAYLVYNPFAGIFPAWFLAERAADVLRQQGWQVTVAQSRNAAHITELACQSVREGCDAFFIVGGDGSINLAVAGLAGSQTALGILPGGTANVLAQELGLPILSWMNWTTLDDSAQRLAHAPIRQVDVGMCNDHPFLLWGGVGLDAAVTHTIDARSRWEKHFNTLHFAAATFWQASVWRGMNLQVMADGHRINGRFLMAVVTNIHLYAGGMANLSPQALLDDGRMDLWLFKGDTLGDAIQRVWDLFTGRHLQSDQTQRIEICSVILESDTPVLAQVDGEPFETSQPVRIAVRPQALRMLVPAQTPHLLFSDR